jgi:putative ABC transport system permease protein
LARRAVRQTDPEQAIIDVVAVAQLAGDSVSDERMIASVMSSFGFAALLLTVVGLYALLAYYVAERTREIGIRMALGAAHVQVVGMVLREGMALVAIGSVVGIIAAVLSARALSHQIAGLGTVDPWAMAAAVLLLATAALLASWLPARRAARVDPMVALRYE